MGDEVISWISRAGKVTLRGDCRPAGKGEWRMGFTLDNEGDDVEVRVTYPYVFYHFDRAQRVRIFNPLFGGVLEPSNTTFNQDYPGQATFCLTAAAGTDQTVAVGLFNAEQRHVIIRHVPAHTEGQIRFICERILIRRGEALDLPALFIRIGANWADAFTPYRDFAASAFPRRRKRPDWLEKGNFTMTMKAHCIAPFYPPAMATGVWIFNNEGTLRTVESLKQEVDEACADGVEKDYTPLFYQFGWWRGMAEIRGLMMFDSTTGDYTEAHHLTREIINYIHAKGARTYLYTNAISVGDESRVFRDQSDLLIRDASGNRVQNGGFPLYMLCPGAPGAKDYWDAILQFILRDLKADGIFLDQVGGGFPACYCYAKDHQHDHPDCYGRDFIQLLEFISRRAQEIKADSILVGELVLDSRSPLLDETHGPGYARITAKPPLTLEERTVSIPDEYYIFTRYLTPQIFSSAKNWADMMDGAAGSHAWPEWRDARRIFESSVRPCATDPSGALVYLFGPVEGKAILAIRTQGEKRQISLQLPFGFKILDPLPPGIAHGQGNSLIADAQVEPQYFFLSTLP
jgi:Domain of unknown function (DUF6259)